MSVIIQPWNLRNCPQFVYSYYYVYLLYFCGIGYKMPFQAGHHLNAVDQFFTGIIYYPYVLDGQLSYRCYLWTQFWANMYTLVLIVLFFGFAYQEYVVKPKIAKGRDTKKTK